MILEGILCQECGGVVDDSIEEVPGYPVTCEDCKQKKKKRKGKGKNDTFR